MSQWCEVRPALSEEAFLMTGSRVESVREEDRWGGKKYDLGLGERHQESEEGYSGQPPRGWNCRWSEWETSLPPSHCSNEEEWCRGMLAWAMCSGAFKAVWM